MLLDRRRRAALFRPVSRAIEESLCVGLEVTMKDVDCVLGKDRLKDRSDIGDVVFPIEKLMKIRDAGLSCVHIEAAMESERDLMAPVEGRQPRRVSIGRRR